ncbi:MAG: hypothetical protein PHG81_12920 [Aliarcobacter sp.]|nr:hypothetical protein [Aliarcobacter sp.]
MAFFWGYDEDGNKKYYDTTSNKITMTPVYDESEDVATSSTLTINSLEDEMAYYGMSPEEIQTVMNKINGLDDVQSATKPITITDPLTNQEKTLTDGTLVSNSAQSLKNTTLYQQSMVELEKGKLQAMNLLNEIQKKQLDMMDYNLIMQSQILGALNDLITATKNQKLTTGTINVNPSVHVDTTALSEATQKIADGVDNQTATNQKIVENLTKKNEHYDFLKGGHPDLKDSSGNAIIPREIEAKKNAEQYIEQEDTNKTTFDEIGDYIGEALGVVEDGIENVLGSTDGFDIDFNPMSYIDEILMKDFQEHKDNYYPDK